MIAFIARRVAQALITILASTALVFFGFRVIPYHPPVALLGTNATPHELATFSAESPIVQYLRILWMWLHGDLGYVPEFNLGLGALLLRAGAITGALVLSSLLLSALIAVPAGFLQAARRDSGLDRVLRIVATVFAATPLIVIGSMLVAYLSIDTDLFPPVGPSVDGLGQLFSNYRAMVLPVVTLSLPLIGRFSQLTRAAVVEQSYLDYVRTAQANGAGSFRVLRRHILPNVSVSLLTYLGLSLPIVLSGALVVEALFNLPGLGYYLYLCAQAKQLLLSVELGVILFTATAVVLVTMLIDIVIRLIDPRS